MQKKLLAVAMIGLLGFAGAVNAKTVRTVFATVIDTTVSTVAYDGCVANLQLDLAKLAPNCPGTATSSYVVFSCGGALQDANLGSQLFETVQMGQMLGKQVRVYVDDVKKVNGLCLVNRVDLK